MSADDNNNECVYLDYNGTTPIYPPVLEAMLPYFTHHFGNPSSSHYFGQEPKRAVSNARRSIMLSLKDYSKCDQVEDISTIETSIVFTGCGTESNNLAIRLALLSSIHKVDNNGLLHVISTNIEHPAITQCLNSYLANGTLTPTIEVTYVAVNEEGIVSAADIMKEVRSNTALVTVMTANNEVGSIQPVFELAKLCRERQVLFHTDAAQAVGKIDLHGLADPTTGADMVTIVGHKFGAPKGIAALYIRPNALTENGRSIPMCGGSVLLMGGGQEGGMRGGTENVPYIVGIGRAATMLFEKRPGNEMIWQYNARHMESMRERLLFNIIRNLEKIGPMESTIVRTNGPADSKQRLPNTLSIGIKGVRSGELLANIGSVVACSAGSACHSSTCDTQSYSSVLKAMNVPPEYAIGTLRLSVGPDTTEEDVDFASEVIVTEVKRQLGL
ncbi:hypothetical protein ACHAXH_005201 [Discostella pseudostelligera]|jgi:cysteine desulfurase